MEDASIAVRTETQGLLTAGMENVPGAPATLSLHVPVAATAADVNDPLAERRAEIGMLMEKLDTLGSYDIAREFQRLGLQKSTEMFPELSTLMANRRQGFLILLNLVRLGKIRTDPARQALAETAYQKLASHRIGLLELAQAVEHLQVGLQGRRYRKMNGLIRQFMDTVGQFHGYMRGGAGYWREVLPLVASGQAATYEEARAIHGEKQRAHFAELRQELGKSA